MWETLVATELTRPTSKLSDAETISWRITSAAWHKIGLKAVLISQIKVQSPNLAH